MKDTLLIYSLALVFTLSTSSATGSGFNLNNIDAAWTTFLRTHNKSYSLAEEIKRKVTFYQSLSMINRHNSDSKTSFKININQFADMTMDEFKKQMNLTPSKFVKKEPKERPLKTQSTKKVPAKMSIFDAFFALFRFPSLKVSESKVEDSKTVDWRSSGHVTEPLYQGKCGGCWAIAAAGAAEAIHSIKYGQLKKLSSQCLIDCAKKPFYQSNGCSGGFLDDAFSYIITNGLPDEDAYPYTGANNAHCSLTGVHRNIVPISSYRDIESEDDLLQAVTKSPVPVAIDADQMSFKLYSSGVYDDTACTRNVNHAVLVVGYDSQSWIIKNSWGTGWGEGGFARIRRGTNMCGISEQAVTPIF